MIRKKVFIISLSLMISLLITGCVSKQKIDDIESTQKEILAKVKAIEAGQKEILQLFKPRRRPAIDYNKVHNIPIGHSQIRGNKDAAITIVEFSDFQCPYCARLQPTLKKVLSTYPDDVRLVYKNFPLTAIHNQAMNAAKAANAAGEQGKYWEMHDILFENYNNLNEGKFSEFAEKLNLDIEKFEADFKSNKYDNQIQQDINLGRSVDVRGTPTLFINGKRMANRTFNDFKTAIAGYLKVKQK